MHAAKALCTPRLFPDAAPIGACRLARTSAYLGVAYTDAPCDATRADCPGETVEAAIIVSVLLSFTEQLMQTGRLAPGERVDEAVGPEDGVHNLRVKKIIKRMRVQIWAGTLTGFFIALCIGAAFIAVFYTKLNDLWAQTEQLWEGIFCLIAAILIFLMGIAFLKMDRSRIKWRYKLAAAFDSSTKNYELNDPNANEVSAKGGKTGRWALFLLPLITLLREGLEAVVFVGGVSMNTSARAIPLPTVIGLIAGFAVGYLIYRTGSTTTLHWFLIFSTFFLFLIGAGLFTRAIWFFEYYKFAKGVGGDVAETGDGPGSYDVHGNVWHFTYGNPEPGSPTTNGGWQIFNAIFGWNNNASIGTILGYVFYWIGVMLALIYYKWSEGRFTFFGLFKSKAYKERMLRREQKAAMSGDYFHTVEKRGDGSSTEGSLETPVAHKTEAPTVTV